MQMAGIHEDIPVRGDRADVLVRRRNGERCVLSALTGSRAVIIIGESPADLGDRFEMPVRQDDDVALLVGIHRLEPDAAPAIEIVFDDAHATPQLMESPSIPIAYVVSGVTPLGPAAVGPEEIESLLDMEARRARRPSGAIELGDLTT